MVNRNSGFISTDYPDTAENIAKIKNYLRERLLKLRPEPTTKKKDSKLKRRYEKSFPSGKKYQKDFLSRNIK